jgi:hypothetical protein
MNASNRGGFAANQRPDIQTLEHTATAVRQRGGSLIETGLTYIAERD